MGGTEAWQASRSWKRAVWSGLLSLVMPGLGQIYARSWRIGVVLPCILTAIYPVLRLIMRFVPSTPATVTVVFAAVIIISLTIRVGSAADAVSRSRRNVVPRPNWLRSTWFACLVFISVNGAIELLLPFPWRMFTIPAASQVPTLLIGDWIVVDTRTAGTTPNRGDVVVFLYPRDHTTDYVKRVIGLSGDHVQMRRGILYINGEMIPRSPAGEYTANDDGVQMVFRRYQESLPGGKQYYIVKATDDGEVNNTLEYIVPPGHFFVLGDNRDNSADSRFMNGVGFVPIDYLVGTARVVTWASDPARRLTWVE